MARGEELLMYNRITFIYLFDFIPFHSPQHWVLRLLDFPADILFVFTNINNCCIPGVLAHLHTLKQTDKHREIPFGSRKTTKSRVAQP